MNERLLPAGTDCDTVAVLFQRVKCFQCALWNAERFSVFCAEQSTVNIKKYGFFIHSKLLVMYIIAISGETKIEVKNVEYVWAFVIGGTICVVGQILIDFTKMTPARILVLFVTLGVLLTGLGWYEPLVKFAGAGATVPLTGFGYLMAKGTLEAVKANGLIGVFAGGVAASAAGIAAAVFFGYLAALFSKPGDKS
jgi:stage V sporulation protein AE